MSVVEKHFFALRERLDLSLYLFPFWKVITFQKSNSQCSATKSSVAFSFMQLLYKFVCNIIHFPLCYLYPAIFPSSTYSSQKKTVPFLIQTCISQGTKCYITMTGNLCNWFMGKVEHCFFMQKYQKIVCWSNVFVNWVTKSMIWKIYSVKYVFLHLRSSNKIMS